MRVGLAALTLVLVVFVVVARDGRLPDDTQFWAVVLSLIVVALLAADECRTAAPLWRSFEGFDAQAASSTVSAAASAQVTALIALPWTAYQTIAPGLEKLTFLIKGGQSGSAPVTVVIKKADYVGDEDAALHAPDGTVDVKLFDAMKLEYKRIAYLLCRMKSILPDGHDAVVTAIGAAC